MSTPKATNNFVFVIRDEVEKEKAGIIIPGKGRVKPPRGEIFSVGGKVTDPDIKNGKGKKAIFYAGIGQEIDIDGTVYLCLNEQEIIGTI